MRYYTLEPEVAGELGPNTIMDTSVHPPRVTHLEYEFHGWSGTDIVESFPCFVVTEALGNALRHSGLGTFGLQPVQVSITPEADDLRRQLGIAAFPPFWRLNITGTAGHDDIGVDAFASLVVSERGLAVLQQFNTQGCDIEDFTG